MRVTIITPAKIDNESQLKWLEAAINSVINQNIDDWSMVVVNDHSSVSWKPLAELFNHPKIQGAKHEGSGPSVAAARNMAADMADGELLLPLDADDRLPQNAVRRFLHHWNNGGSKRGIVYSQVKMFDDGTSRLYEPPEYDFGFLLKHTFMTVGCLHRREDWKKVGGWDADFDRGLEDWEYWIRLGAAGICGYRANEVLYEYRRHIYGRLAMLKETQSLWSAAQGSIRQKHLKLYRGDWPMGCCSGSRGTLGKIRPSHSRVSAVSSDAQLSGDKVTMEYTGGRSGGFGIQGPSGNRYRVPGSGGQFNVAASDVHYLQRYNHGRDFRRVQ